VEEKSLYYLSKREGCLTSSFCFETTKSNPWLDYSTRETGSKKMSTGEFVSIAGVLASLAGVIINITIKWSVLRSVF
jgi:hypothetical protein